MILGTAAGLPVVACVSTNDRLSTLLECPYCNEIHIHGGHGPTSPGGAVDGGRLSHCSDHDARQYYVIKEIAGTATIGLTENPIDPTLVKAITYDRRSAKLLAPQIAALIERYEHSWAGPGLRTGYRDPGDLAYQRGLTPWPAAHHGLAPIRPGEPTFPALVGTTGNQVLYRFYDQYGILLYVGITGDAATRWSNHSRKKDWWPLVRRIDVEPFDSRPEVEAAERKAILGEQPMCNVVHNRRRMRPTDPQHFADACHQCAAQGNPMGSHPAVEMDWRSRGLDTLHHCPAGHQWTCSWGDQLIAYEDCACSWCLITTGQTLTIPIGG